MDMYDPKSIEGRPNCPDVPRDDLWGYYAQTTFLDDQFQRLLDTIRDLGIEDETIIIFTSDHGDMHGSHGVYKKQWPWSEASKVPFVIRYPNVVTKGATLNVPLSVIDIMPTLLGLTGLPIPDTVEGVDLSSILKGNSEDAPESVLIMNPCPFSIGDKRGYDQYPDYKGMRIEYRGVITTQYTYVHTIDQPWLLFDNTNDPYQTKNLIDDPTHAKTCAHLDELMRQHMVAINDEIMPRDYYYKHFKIDLDHRGKVVNLVENMYNRSG
tara:strand:+ start:25 stop:825 length:801 start_codon:yes stop_codon:yes gene_type:complete